jgi:mRNA deadenylase 3'-5' endonuclease subunit Ccr4
MESQEFLNRLIEVQNLMKEEKYKKALILLDQLKEIEQKGDFDYSLTHKLYQLDSNTKSLYNQQILMKYLDKLQKEKKTITFEELKALCSEDLNLDIKILRREIELLILRGVLSCKVEGNKIMF